MLMFCSLIETFIFSRKYIGLNVIALRFWIHPYPFPRQQKFREMNWAQSLAMLIGPSCPPIHCPVGNKIWGQLGKEDLCPNFALTVGKFVFSNAGNFRAKANPPKPRSCPKRPFGK